VIVSAVDRPSTYGSFSSTMKCRRSGTAISTPSVAAAVSHRNDASGERSRWNGVALSFVL